MARAHTDTAINVLAGIMREPSAPHAARVAAATALMDRGWGKPHQTSDVNIRNITAKDLSDNELANIASGGGEGDTDPPLDPSQLN